VNTTHTDLIKFRNSTDSSLVTIVQAIKELGKAVIPTISKRNASTQPPPPDDLKYTCRASPDKKDGSPDYPVLVLGQYSYWGKHAILFFRVTLTLYYGLLALSYIDNRFAMAILAYNSNGNIVGRWSKQGSRYVCRIEYDKDTRQVSFIGQGETSVTFKLGELKVSGHTGFLG
jgi:hypothetical protein